MTEKPAVHLSVGAALLGLGHDILAQARDVVEDRTPSGTTTVHSYRKTMKRWRALLRLLAPFLGREARTLQDTARELARELAGARDLQASLDALSDLAHHDAGLPSNSFIAMRKRIEQDRELAETTALTEQTRERLHQATMSAMLALARWRLEDLSFPELAGELARTFRAAQRAIPHDWAAAPSHELHQLRKHVVEHRYQIEMIEPLWPRMTRLWVAEAQCLRDRLGAHHDLEILSNCAAPDHPLASWHSRLAPLIAARQAKHTADSRRLAARLFAERPKAFRRRLEALWETKAAGGAHLGRTAMRRGVEEGES
jgi:CHAD domain-containing protein